MTRRIVIGNMGNGQMDMRISRPGFDALTANVGDRNQISFAMSRDSYARVAAAGEIFGLGQWVYFAEWFSAPPPVVVGSQVNGAFRVGDYVRYTGNNSRFHDGSPYIAVVTNNAIAMQAANNIPWVGEGLNKFTFMVVAR